MNFEVVLLPAMCFVGTELRTTWKNNECIAAIPSFWQQQRSTNSVQKIPNQLYPSTIFGLYTNYTSDFSLTSGYYSLIIGCPVKNSLTIPKGMIAHEIPAAKYAVFTVKGPFYLMEKAWLEIWQNKNIKRTFTNDFEWYDSKSTNDENSVVKIYIAIE